MKKRAIKVKRDIDAAGHRAKIKVKSDTDTDEVGFGFEGLEDKFSIQLSKFQKVGSAAWFKANIDFTKIVEYVEVDGIPGLTKNDTIGTEYAFGQNRTWDFVDTSPVVAGVEGAKSFEITDGLFTIMAEVAGSNFMGSDDLMHSPTGTKFDIMIDTKANGFQYILPESRLALVAKVWSRDSQEDITLQDSLTGEDQDDAIIFGSGKATFSWKKTVEVLPQESIHEVIASDFPDVVDIWIPPNTDDDDDDDDDFNNNDFNSDDDDDDDDDDDEYAPPEDTDIRPWFAREVVFSFSKIQPEIVVWDPELDVTLRPEISSAPAHPSISLVLCSLLTFFLLLRN